MLAGKPKYITTITKQCSRYPQATKLPPHEPPSLWPNPKIPWSRVHPDFTWSVGSILCPVTADLLSKWAEVIMSSTAATFWRSVNSKLSPPTGVRKPSWQKNATF
ncbi:hypothetical protein FBUS_09318 [Fasciolopsis buskii]|uniref:Uncharacterized protein n=1 Tax=Fasciolopsis buskii TaxID=27845 RepID=A0A8E0S1T2_9TREM|nr:hypothetical protein FBUS_09318 [Fasciolopsis buski]